MMRYLVAYVFTLCFSLSAMDYSILICNTTDQPFEIRTTIVDDRTKNPVGTLHSSTSVSDVWYGGSAIHNGDIIPAGEQKRLFVKLDPKAHIERSDFIVLQNHEGYFCINFGRVSDNLKPPLPVVTKAVSTDIQARHAKVFGDEVSSESGKYKSLHVSSRRDGAEVITISRAQ